MNALNDLIAAKLGLLQQTIDARFSLLSPYLMFLLLVMIVGGYEGNDWRRQRLYAGYYHLIFLSSMLFFLVSFAALAIWMGGPSWFPIRTLILSLTAPAFALGWTLMAGRPVLR